MNKIAYAPVDTPATETETDDNSSNGGPGEDGFRDEEDGNDENAAVPIAVSGDDNAGLSGGSIDYAAVGGLVEDLSELRRGLFVLVLLFVATGCVIALDDHYYPHIDETRSFHQNENDNNDHDHHDANHDASHDANHDEPLPLPPHPHRGHKLQINASAFTVNDFECLRLDTGNWPSERVHCELRPSGDNDGDDDAAEYDFVVEHFDDDFCRKPNAENPVVRHTASGCFFFEAYNHSYNDKCHANRTFTVSAFYGPGCLNPMPVTAPNVLPEEGWR